MTVSQDEHKVGVALGKFKIKDEYEITEIVIYNQDRQGKFEIDTVRDFHF